jgi:hypothetical protein
MAARLDEYASYGPVDIFGGPAAVSEQVAAQAGVLVLPSAEQAIGLGQELQVDIGAGKSIALSFDAAKGDEILAAVDGNVSGTLFSPQLEKIGLSIPFGHGNRQWELFGPLADSGTHRLVLYAQYSAANVKVTVSRPADLPE